MTQRREQERRGFVGGWQTIDFYRQTQCSDVPDLPGVYLVYREELDPPRWLADSPVPIYKGKPAAYPISTLSSRWDDRARLLYYGQAGGQGSKATLRRRIKQYLAWSAGKTGHAGGRAIWQIAGAGQFRIAWAVQQRLDPLDVERELLDDHVAKYGRLPFANFRR
ncbi:MAG: hypothetical protein AAGK09_04855 [Planctomycetota bacterium]